MRFIAFVFRLTPSCFSLGVLWVTLESCSIFGQRQQVVNFTDIKKSFALNLIFSLVADAGESSSEEEALVNLDAAHDLGVFGADFSSRIITCNNNKNTIYTLATCGTDHLIKLWKIISTQPEKGSLRGYQPIIIVEKITTVLAHGSTVTSVRY